MEQMRYDYSLKNIPVAYEKEYIKALIMKAEKFIINCRWKALAYKKKFKGQQNNYGFKSPNCPQIVRELIPIELDIVNMIKNIKFKRYSNHLQSKLHKDCKDIKRTEKLIIQADKTSNMYKMTTAEYDKIMLDSITKDYLKDSGNRLDNINNEAKGITEKLNISDRVRKYPMKNAYPTLKDHKPNFEQNPTVRVINPASSNIGRIAQQILTRINEQLRQKLGVTQWKSSLDVIEWFKKIENKKNKRFLKFDITSFYPSINEKLLNKGLELAKLHTDIKKDEIEIIQHCRKNLLFYKDETWVKKINSDFDVPMGAYDSAEISELCGITLLHDIKQELGGIGIRCISG